MDTTEITLTWMCKTCGDVLISKSSERHKMDVCKCGESGVDLEDGYQRGFGQVVDIERVVQKSNKKKTI